MRIFLVLICSLALACVAGGAQKEQKENTKKKKAAPAGQVSKPAAGKVAGKPTGTGKPVKATKSAQVGKPTGAGKPAKVTKSAQAGKATGAGKPAKTTKVAQAGKPIGAGKPAKTTKVAQAGKPLGAGKPAKTTKAAQVGKPTGAGKPAKATKSTGVGKPAVAAKASGKPFKPKRFNLASKSKPAKSVAPAVTFQQNRRIRGSDRWVGSNYQIFRNYRSEWHDRDWWRHHHSRLTFVFGGWYFWNAGYWFPAWGYDPGAYYAYDGPIYAYNDLPPDQVIANVQAALQQQGYYRGEVDGLLGPLTREAVANYQRDHGLYVTSAIDRPTLETLGMA